MSRAKKSLLHSPASASVTSKSFSLRPAAFVFFDRKSGVRRFEVKAGDDGRMPAEQAASLLAIHCVARQQQPRDFDVMVAAGEDLVGRNHGPREQTDSQLLGIQSRGHAAEPAAARSARGDRAEFQQ